MNSLKVFFLFALAHGCFSLGISLFIIYYFFPKKYSQVNKAHWHTLIFMLSYLLLTACTLITASKGIYNTRDGWFYFVAVGYLSGDISLLILFKNQVKKIKLEENRK